MKILREKEITSISTYFISRRGGISKNFASFMQSADLLVGSTRVELIASLRQEQLQLFVRTELVGCFEIIDAASPDRIVENISDQSVNGNNLLAFRSFVFLQLEYTYKKYNCDEDADRINMVYIRISLTRIKKYMASSGETPEICAFFTYTSRVTTGTSHSRRPRKPVVRCGGNSFRSRPSTSTRAGLSWPSDTYN